MTSKLNAMSQVVDSKYCPKDRPVEAENFV